MSVMNEEYSVCTLKFKEFVFKIIISKYDNFDNLSAITCWLTKNELYRKEKNEVSEKDNIPVFSQFSESESHNWSVLVYVFIQFVSKKFENCLVIMYVNF